MNRVEAQSKFDVRGGLFSSIDVVSGAKRK